MFRADGWHDGEQVISPDTVPIDTAVRPTALRTNDNSGLITTAFRRPTLSWRLIAERDAVRQRAYEIQRSSHELFTVDLLSSGPIEAAQPFGAAWIGPDLTSREVTWLRLRVWTDCGRTDWSEPLRIEGGLFETSDWTARPISPAFNVGRVAPAPVPLLRREFAVPAPVTSARLYVSALGLHEISINGQPVSADLLEPGWTNYRSRLLYSAYDVTSLLRSGGNAIGASIADGWWRGNLTWTAKRAVYGDTTALLAQLEITYHDGSRQTVATDNTWVASTGGLLAADIYDGAELDLALVPAGWSCHEFEDAGWTPTVALSLPVGLEQRSMAAVREVDTFDVAFERSVSGRIAIDCGQNLSGYLRLTLSTDRRATVTVRHAEILDPEGRLHTAPLRTAKASDIYHLVPGTFVVAPSFTYHGFRYAEIELDDDIEVARIEACVISSALQEIGRFRCSDARLNQLDSNIRWSQRGNFISLPTDCPQRDERLGWTGDIQVFAPTACTNFDARAFLASWLVDLASEQAEDGQVTSTVPNVIQNHPYEFAGVGWGDAATLVPWALYEAYGDQEVLRRQFPSMRRWVDWAASRLNSAGIWVGDFHLGDWLDPGAPPDKPEEATTDRDFIASAYLAFSAGRLARSAALLSEPSLAEWYDALSARVATATWRRWRETVIETQTGCAMAIAFGIVPPDEVARVGGRFAALVEQAQGRIAAGFLGTPLLLPALTAAGQHETAFRLLLNEKAPGWLYQVKNGATTMWERWDAIQPDGQIHGGGMAAEDAESMISFNHYAYGSVGAWLYRTLAGIAPDEVEPGYALIQFRPQPGGGIGWAEAAVETPFGTAAIAWREEADRLHIRCEIPPGALGRLTVPTGWVELDAGVSDQLPSGTHERSLTRSEALRRAVKQTSTDGVV